ncbi:hypothetical protein ACFV4P_19605 [Kitasatospora sp. NPDC059795]|uniref:hypothetical protein n=1 Tax=Kitasatospora sp. NPDC059795 TaxID=3346949 RepID=UPI00365A1555
MSMEAALLESRTLRSGLCERTEVLDEVKALVLLSDGLHVTTRMVADYFGVGEKAVYSLVGRHREELESNGYVVLRSVGNPDNQSDKVSLWQVGGLPQAEAGDPSVSPVDNSADQTFKMKVWQVSDLEGPAGRRPQGGGNGIALYSRRAVLNVAMLLRDSEVARAVRSRLLDLVERAAEPPGVRPFRARPWKRWSELRWDEEEAVRRDPAVAAWRRRIDGLEPFEECLPAAPPVGEEWVDVAEPADALGSVDRRLEAQGVVISAISARVARQESRLDAHGGRLDALSEDVRAIRRDVALLRRRRRG